LSFVCFNVEARCSASSMAGFSVEKPATRLPEGRAPAPAPEGPSFSFRAASSVYVYVGAQGRKQIAG
jgi:hypothetical protein